jgi:hypothetical protein
MGRTVRANIYEEILKTPKDLLWQRRVYKKDDMREYRKLCRELNKLLYVKNGGGKRLRRFGPRSALSSQQNCVVKLRTGKAAYAHKRFIQEYLPQEHKKEIAEKPALFSAAAVGEQAVDQYSKAMTGKHFKFIISPESAKVDLQALVKTLAKRMEKITGYSFVWMAAIHRDTDHPHAHLLLNGVDRAGKDVWFDKLFISQTMREMSRQICTEMIGKRSREEIKESVLKSGQSNRHCAFDDLIQEQEEPLPVPDAVYGSRVQTFDDLLLKRLFHLAELGLAKKLEKASHVFLLEKGWNAKLRAIGRYNSFLKARSELRSADASAMELYTQETGEISGVVTKLYKMNDEDSWNHALLVENAALQKAWHIPLYYEPDDSLLGAEINCGMKSNQKGLLVPHIAVKKWNAQNRRAP